MKIRQRHVMRHSPRVEYLERRELMSMAGVAWTEAHVASLRNTVLRLLHPFRTPVRATRQIFAENRTNAINLAIQGFL